MADTLILLDVPFRAHILEQAIARVWRIGATTQAKVHYLKLDTGTEPNITDRTFDILAWAKSEVEAITGVTSPIDVTKLNEDNDKD
jgi:SNF2 family DNA or RNA helicase